ncbi:MAG TPA: L,D-transpeptidase [Thermoanaerobaculia bacterium]|nr:L,D-transpeptidase [Thermoanaerobaculia bacterium]
MEVTTRPSIDPLARAAFATAPARRPRFDRLPAVVAAAASLIAAAVGGGVLMALVGAWAGGYRYQPLAQALAARAPAATATEAAAPADPAALRKLEGEHRRLVAALERRTPRGSYIVVDRTNNLLYLRNSDQVLLDTICSAGSGSILKDPAGNRTWVFDTPRGVHRVITILKNPVWRKPDWAFIEEGRPIPKDPRERFEAGTLGEYGLYFGDGFLIHGTLYERLLGRNVTHGCIRLGKKDLRQVVEASRIGSQIYIF